MKEDLDRKEGAVPPGIEIPGIPARKLVKSWNSQTREDWIDEQAATREAVRAYHDDEGHTWPQTAEHFNMSQGAVRQRCYRARKERAAEAEEKARNEAHKNGMPFLRV